MLNLAFYKSESVIRFSFVLYTTRIRQNEFISEKVSNKVCVVRDVSCCNTTDNFVESAALKNYIR